MRSAAKLSRFRQFFARQGWTSPLLVASATIALFLFSALTLLNAGLIYNYQDSVDMGRWPEVDAIVCLAGGRGRIAAAGDLWFRYWEAAQVVNPPTPFPDGRSYAVARPAVPVLYLSGVGPQSTRASVNPQFRRGVAPALGDSFLYLERESTTTVENAEVFARVARERGWKRVLLVTSSYHMVRARSVFERMMESRGVPLVIDTWSVIQEPFSADEWFWSVQGVRVTVEEYFKSLWVKSIWSPDRGA